MRAKLGLADPTAGRDAAEDADADPDGDRALLDDLLRTMHEQGADHTNTYRALSSVVRGDDRALRDQLRDRSSLDAWLERYAERRATDPRSADDVAAAMDRVNPRYVPRNHLVDEALVAATAGDLGAVRRLLDVVARPFDDRPGLEAYALPAPPEFGDGFQTFCGT